MTILALGLNHDSAPLAVREKIAFAGDAVLNALTDLRNHTAVAEAAILSTCNRTELYCRVVDQELDQPLQWLHGYHDLGRESLMPYLYRHDNEAAVRHVLRVATGLDSMILGEPEILGQMKSAWHLARQAESLEQPLDRLFQHAFSTAKRIRSETAIGKKPVSVASTAVSMARRLFGDFDRQTALLIGAGETIELTARHLVAQNVRHLLIANRTLGRAQELANRFGGSALALSDLERHLPKADAIFSSTAADHAIVTAAQLAKATHLRKRKPIFVLDLAVPRDIEPDAAQLPDVYLYTIDDIQRLAEQGLASRRAAADQAEHLIEDQVEKYMQWLAGQSASQSIQRLRQRSARWRDEELERAKRQLASGKSPEQALESLAHKITQRLLHDPSVQLREASSHGRHDLLSAAHELFGLNKPTAVNEDSDDDASLDS